MNKIGMNRTWGIILSLAILITAFILFNLLSYLKMNRQIDELEQIAMTYNTNYNRYLETSRNLKNYNEKINERVDEFIELERLMEKNAFDYSKTDSTITFSGRVQPEKLANLLNFLSNAKTLKINKLDTQSQAELPLLIGESKTPDMYIKEMEIELIQIDNNILEG